MKKIIQKIALFSVTTAVSMSCLFGCAGAKVESNKSVPDFSEVKTFRLFADRPCTPTIENLTVYKDAGFTHYNMTEDDYHITNADGKFGYNADVASTSEKENLVTMETGDNGEIIYKNANKEVIPYDEEAGADDGVLNPKYAEAFSNAEKVGLKTVIRNYYACAKYFKNDTEETRDRDITLSGVTYRIPKRDISADVVKLPTLDGFYMGDEPSWAFIDTIAPIVDWYNENAYGKMESGSDGWFHINLLQTYGNYLFAGHSYDEYVQKYCDVILSRVKGPKTLGTDYYPLEYKAATGEPYIKNGILTDYFAIAQKTKDMNATIENENDKVLTNFCIQTFNSENTKWRDISSQADVTFQTNLAMAFGAKSLQYYLYRASSGDAGIINQNTQQPTVMYPWVKEANRQAQLLASTILCFNWVGAKTFAGTQLSSDYTVEGFDAIKDRELEKFALVSEVSARLDTVISEMEDKSGNKAYMVVNFSEPSLSQTDYVMLTFEKGVKEAIVYIKGEPQTMEVINGKLQLKLEAGDGAFVYPVFK